jgi:hypothetical protein
VSDQFMKNRGSDLLEGFSVNFPDWQFGEYYVNLKLGARMNVFCCQVKTIDELVSEWRKISSFIAAKSITLSNPDFTRWNSYLVYFCEEPVPRALKYEIENDKFASRKMVEGPRDGGDESIIEFLNQELLLSHIHIKADCASQYERVLGVSEFGQSIVGTEISTDSGVAVKSARKALLARAVLAEVERLSHED